MHVQAHPEVTVVMHQKWSAAIAATWISTVLMAYRVSVMLMGHNFSLRPNQSDGRCQLANLLVPEGWCRRHPLLETYGFSFELASIFISAAAFARWRRY
jgi:hypothetical protein